jgi:hypothetical protein
MSLEPEKDLEDRPENAAPTGPAQQRRKPSASSAAGTQTPSQSVSEDTITPPPGPLEGLLVRDEGKAINWGATIQSMFGNLGKYLDLFVTALFNPAEYEIKARALGVKTGASSEPARSTHGDAATLPKGTEPRSTDKEKDAASKKDKPEADGELPETTEDMGPPAPETPISTTTDTPKHTHHTSAADDVFEHSPALAAASLKFNNHFAAAVAGPQAQEPSMALDLTNAPTLGRVA